MGDADRLRFLLTDLTRIRLQKIERYALHVREEGDRLSKDERTFLRQYGELFEKHMRQSVTDRLPKEAWKSLDEPEMIMKITVLHTMVLVRHYLLDMALFRT